MRQMFVVLMAVLSAFVVAVPVASAAGSGKFCLKGPGAAMDCHYQTMASCDKNKKGAQTCVINPPNTTGSGSSGNNTSGSVKK